MPLTTEQRESVEEVVLDLHFTAQKYIDTGKDVHRKLLEVNVQEAMELLEAIKENMKDDEKMYDYKMHMLMPFHIYELIKLREENTEEDDQ